MFRTNFSNLSFLPLAALSTLRRRFSKIKGPKNQEPTNKTPRAYFSKKSFLRMGFAGTTAALALSTFNEQRRKDWVKQIFHFQKAITAAPVSPFILEIPGLPQNEGVIHGVTTCGLGNFGFVTLNEGIKAPELVSTIQEGLKEIAHFTEVKSLANNAQQKPLLIVNETAYANTNAAGLQKVEGQPQFILTLTQDNIGSFVSENRFPETGDFAALRDSCIRVIADGFVSNLSEFNGQPLYFAINTADAAPLILMDAESGVIGVMSCSWHNVAKGEVNELIDKMKQLGAKPSQISMGIGPGLGPKSFEFGANEARYFYEPGLLDKRDGRSFQGRPFLKKHFSPHPKDPQKVMVNLPGILTDLAVESGISVQKVHFDREWDTMVNSSFFSARRTTPSHERLSESSKKYPKTARGLTFVHREKRPQPQEEAVKSWKSRLMG